MNDLEKFNQLPFSSKLAIVSWALGTFILLLNFCFPNQDKIIITGIVYIVVMGIINGITFLYIISKIITSTQNSRYYIIQAGIMLANIPIAILYAYLVISHYTSLNNF